jgi:D-tyrosyl-tRNA(Tyr) deacylase
MRLVIQRVSKAACVVDQQITGEIGRGLLIFVGVDSEDTEEDVNWLADKLPKIRIFEDDEGKMNRSLEDIKGEVLAISQFTLHGNLRKGTRPSFNRAASPEKGKNYYDTLVQKISENLGKTVPTGIFGAHMEIEAHNDGPVTLILDSKDKKF